MIGVVLLPAAARAGRAADSRSRGCCPRSRSHPTEQRGGAGSPTRLAARRGVWYQGAMRTPGFLRPVVTATAALVGVAGLLVAVASGSTSAVLPSLYVTYVGSNCTFTLVGDSGNSVTTIAPGTYQLELSADDFVSCPNALPNFQLAGPGVLVQTPIDNGTGAAANYTVTLQPGATYVAQDLNQPLSKISFTTTVSGSPAAVTVPATVPASTTTSSTPDVVGSQAGSKPSKLVFRGTLAGTVSPTGALALTYDGKHVTEIDAGRYTVSVVDRSKTSGFVIQQVNKLATTVTTRRVRRQAQRVGAPERRAVALLPDLRRQEDLLPRRRGSLTGLAGAGARRGGARATRCRQPA